MRSRPGWADTVGMLARLTLGGVLLVSGILKLADLTGAIQSVVAYEIFDYEGARLVATMLPVVEVAVGALLLVGLLTRASAVVAGLLMLAFIAGITSAWSRGLTIDCGCFSSGGLVDPGETTYLLDILRDLGLLVLAGWLIRRPRMPWSIDALLLKGR